MPSPFPAMAWMLGSQWASRLLGLVASVVLARLLSPRDFGVAAVATSYLMLVEGLTTFNVGQALIRLRASDPALLNTAWTLGFARGTVLALLIFASSGLVAGMLGEPELDHVIRVIATVPMISGLANPKFVIYEQQSQFSGIAIVDVVSKLLSSACTIGFAFAHHSYWAIIVGFVTGAAARVALTYWMAPYRPRGSVREVRRIFGFSGWLTLANAINTLNYSLDNLIVARVLGFRDAGLYQMTRQIAALPTTELIVPLQRVLFPSLTAIASHPTHLRSGVLDAMGAASACVMPIAFGLGLVAPELVPLVFGVQWGPIVPLLQIVLPFFAGGLILTIVQPAAMAVGATREIFLASMHFGSVRIPIFVFSTYLGGVVGAMYGLAVLSIIWWANNFLLLQKVVEVRISELIAVTHRSLIAIASMALVVRMLPNALTLLNLEPGTALLLLIEVLVGALVYIGIDFALWVAEGKPRGIERRLIHIVNSRGRTC